METSAENYRLEAPAEGEIDASELHEIEQEFEGELGGDSRPQSASPRALKNCSVLRDIPYKQSTVTDKDVTPETAFHSKHHLDIYIPEKEPTEGALYPVVVHVHGGGWVRGDRQRAFYGAPAMSQAFARNNFLAVAPSYRLKKHPWCIEDVITAMNWVFNNITQYKGDPNRLFLCGHSAGGHLVSLLASDPARWTATKIPWEALQGVISVSGIYSLRKPLCDCDWSVRNWVFNSMYVKPVFGQDDTVLNEASPLWHARQREQDNTVDQREMPPFLVFNAGMDLGLDLDGKRWVEQLKKLGISVRYEKIGWTSHRTINQAPETHSICAEFITGCLQKEKKTQ
eukprot:TRINITY_DN33687_c0_g1_i1.p1 TRINITY_DN33687_c0_g1~~TRINITY_DN33687_c0_g1_i1.p1  ORF type:complete len:341 (-),score=26.44 TRINITY_DN33687_c0_g1_i1:25-1047(-)